VGLEGLCLSLGFHAFFGILKSIQTSRHLEHVQLLKIGNDQGEYILRLEGANKFDETRNEPLALDRFKKRNKRMWVAIVIVNIMAKIVTTLLIPVFDWETNPESIPKPLDQCVVRISPTQRI
jgi:hypothetical protein